MSEIIQITLIICGTIILCTLSGILTFQHGTRKPNTQLGEKIKYIKPPRDTERFGYCQSPTYPAPSRLGVNDTSRLDEIFKRG